MVSSGELITVIARKLRQYGARHIVVDPVMVATSGAKLLRDEARTVLMEELLPLAEVVTPNIPEAELLSGRPIATPADMEAAACDYEKLNELVGQKDAAQAELDALYERWEQLSEEAEG